MNIAVFCSGVLGAKLLASIVQNQSVQVVFTDSASAGIIEYCKRFEIDCYIGNPRNARATLFLRNFKIDVIVSINYLFLIEEAIFSQAKLLAFNIHGSLLPKYRGRTPHVWAIINNESVTGVTAHKIDSGCDTGDIIEQVPIEISINDTGADILKKYEIVYEHLVFSILDQIKSNSVILTPQDPKKATYFGKRTPVDGQIDWSWHKERIRNWVRAQAYPYPGAFSILRNEKFIIDEVAYTDIGFTDKMSNGLVISTDPLLIKCPNGVIEIRKTRSNLIINEGDILR